MRTLRLLTWLTQLGMSVVAPLVVCVWAAVFLRGYFNLGDWVVLVGVVFGIGSALSGFRNSLYLMRREAEAGDKEKDPPPTAFNDHI
ncbi:MAG: AtpZ/AtpI family protein [Clostridia bacterium]|nr:AtpZ/AtpI family protein [Clostridia bacterium]